MKQRPPSRPPADRACAKQAALDVIVRQGFVPIFVNDSLDSRRLVEGAAEAGCTAIEYTCRRPDARRMIPWIKREFPDLVILAATLVDGLKVGAFLHRTRDGFLTVDEAVDLGADALVSFMRFRPQTYAQHAARCVIIPGVATQNEAIDQMELGADLIKTTVNTVAGSEFVTKTGVATHQCIPFFISGGVRPDNIDTYVQAGVVAAAAGFDVLLGGAPPAGAALARKAAESIRHMTATMQDSRQKHQPALAAAARQGLPDLLSHGPWYHTPRRGKLRR